MKIDALTLALTLTSSTVGAAAPALLESSGWLESAWVTWKPVAGAQGYNVYVSGGTVASRKLDDPLIRSYGTYWRADALGLQPGSYTLRVVPVTGGVEGTSATTTSLSVQAHDRSGFAFQGGHVPGAYALDGTLKAGARVIYLAEPTKDTVSMTVAGVSTPCVGIQAILDAYDKGKETRPLAIRVIGMVTPPAYSADGDILLENGNSSTSGITLEGVGNDATASGWGVRVKGASDCEVRNLGVVNVNSNARDDIGLQQANDHIWVHHNDHFYGIPGSDADQFKGDGAMDVKKTTYVTISYDHFWDNGKSSLVGLSEGQHDTLAITFHHNWFDHSDSRHPRIRFYSAHVYNNFYDGIAKYGVGSTDSSSVFVEANYFRAVHRPIMTSMQGSDVWNPATQADDYKNIPTFSGEPGGSIKAFGNKFDGIGRFVAYGDPAFPNSTVDFDAWVPAKRSDAMPSTVKAYKGSATYNNFDTKSTMYSYPVDSPDEARAKVVAGAGRMGGGDLRWTFDNAVDDTADALNGGLKAAVLGYRSALVAIQGIGTVGTGSTGLDARLSRSWQPIHLDAATGRLVVDAQVGTGTATILSPSGAVLHRSSIGPEGLSLAGLPRGFLMVRVTSPSGTFQRGILKAD